ncbi:MAG: M23 family metallopeptidase [Bacteroidales bacterium]|nr:M23 family metallopeptidase [Bacteroidales bacterium]
MSDDKYTFDPNSLSFEETDRKKGKKIIISIITQLLAAVSIGLLVFLTISYTIKTPGQRKVERENEAMREVHNQLNARFEQTEIVLEDLRERDREIYRAIFSTAPPLDDDSMEYNYSGLGEIQIASHYTKTTNKVVEMLRTEDSTVNSLFAMLEERKDSLKYIPSVMPLDNTGLQYLAYGYGKKLDPIYKTPQVHKGIDFAAPKGTVVSATASGTVEYVGEKRDHGVMVIIDHKNGFKTIYSHLSDYVVRTGKKVKRGETIGFVGNTGKSLTAHLHYEINYKGKAINPIDFFFEDTDPETYHKLKMMANNGGLCLD